MKSNTTNNRKNKRSEWLYGRISPDKTLEVLQELLNEEPDYNAILANLAGCSMASAERGDFGVDDSGDDLGDDWN